MHGKSEVESQLHYCINMGACSLLTLLCKYRCLFSVDSPNCVVFFPSVFVVVFFNYFFVSS